MHPGEQIKTTIERIYSNGLTTTSGGNISVKHQNGDVWITPSAVDKGRLRASDLVCVSKNGRIEGKHKPSSEYAFHKAVYDCRPDLKALIHAHSPALVAFSIARKKPDTNLTPQAAEICGKIGYAGYFKPGSTELGTEIARQFEQNCKAVIMENHGIVVAGKNLEDALRCFETLEFTASVILNATKIGLPNYLTDNQISEYKKQTLGLMPEIQMSKPILNEKLIREEVVSFFNRALSRGLISNSFGSISQRLRGNDFLITPENTVYSGLQAENLVLIKDDKRKQGKFPSVSAWHHSRIYKKHKHINSIIISQTPYLTAFSVTGKKLDIRSIPEGLMLLKDIENIPFEAFLYDKDLITNTLSEKRPSVIINNYSFLVTGKSLLATFDKLEVAEFCAKSLIISSSLGDPVPISQKQIKELEEMFLSKI